MHRVPRARRPGQIHALPRSAREAGVEERVGRRDLDLVIARPVARGIEEDLDHVRRVQLLVVLEERAGDVGVDGEERDVEMVVIPEQARLGGGAGGLAVDTAYEGTGLFGAIPVGFGEHSLGVVDEAALQGLPRLSESLGISGCERKNRELLDSLLARPQFRFGLGLASQIIDRPAIFRAWK